MDENARPFACLDAPAAAVPFCRLVGTSPQNVGLLRQRQILTRDGTYREWIEQYCGHIRRGHESSDTLLRAKTDDVRLNTELKRLRLTRQADLHTEYLQPLLNHWASRIREAVQVEVSRLAADIQAGVISSDANDIFDRFRVALDSASRYPEQLEIADGPSGEPFAAGASDDLGSMEPTVLDGAEH